MKKTILTISLSLFLACNNSTNQLSEEQRKDYLNIGDSITTQSQQALLSNVSKQMKAGGPKQAVDFCSEKAIPLVDSLSQTFKVEIQRVSDRNRNPNNALTSEMDKKAWQQLLAQLKTKTMPNHLLMEDKDGVYYYKAIPLGMPTCLACHGEKNKDIAPETLEIIAAKYPNDKATGYIMGELRGMWKVKMK